MRGIVESKYKVLYKQLIGIEEELSNLQQQDICDNVIAYRKKLEQIYLHYRANLELINIAVCDFDRQEKIIKRMLVVYKRNIKIIENHL